MGLLKRLRNRRDLPSAANDPGRDERMDEAERRLQLLEKRVGILEKVKKGDNATAHNTTRRTGVGDGRSNRPVSKHP